MAPKRRVAKKATRKAAKKTTRKATKKTTRNTAKKATRRTAVKRSAKTAKKSSRKKSTARRARPEIIDATIEQQEEAVDEQTYRPKAEDLSEE